MTVWATNADLCVTTRMTIMLRERKNMYIPENHNLKPSKNKVWLASPTMHGDEMEYIKEAYETNWMSTVGAIGILGTCP